MRVGLSLPIGERGEERRPYSYQQLRELAVAAEKNGLASIWVADHLFYAAPDKAPRGMWESLSILAALADATERVEFGPLVLCTPFRNPGLIAWMANTLEEISGGRFVLGLGAGWHQPEFDAFGFEFDSRVSFLAESLEVILPLLRDGQVDFQGRFACGNAELRPLGPRPQGPPIMIAGTRPRMMSLIARSADRWNSVWYGLPTDEFRGERADLLAACETVGRDPATIEISAGLVIADPDESTGTNGPEELAPSIDLLIEGLAAWRAEGVDEVICSLRRPTVELVHTLARAAERI